MSYLDKITDKAPVGFWEKMRAYDEVLYVEGKKNLLLGPTGRQTAGWQWQTERLEASEEVIAAQPVHVKWTSFRSLGGFVVKGGLRITEIIADPQIPLSEQDTLPATSKLLTYDMKPHLIGFPVLLGGPHLTAVGAALHENVRDTQAWNDETEAAGMAAVAESRQAPGAKLLTPSPEDYDLALYYMELGVKTDDRRPL